jgi:hypothetical protein
MNKQTKAYRKLGLSVVVNKGTGGASSKPFDVFKGKPCITGFGKGNPMNKRKSPWRGIRSKTTTNVE